MNIFTKTPVPGPGPSSIRQKAVVTCSTRGWNDCRRMHLILTLRRWFTRGKLPDFIVIGAQKAGTTALWSILQQHPDVELAPKYFEPVAPGKWAAKETFFFSNDRKYARGIGWYRSLFNANGRLQGEVTPAYIANFKAHARMKKDVPDARLILLVRNPVKRAFSAFNHMVRAGMSWERNIDIHASFADNISREIESGFPVRGIVRRGFYIDQIEHLLGFFPRNQLLVLVAEDLRVDQTAVMERTCAFLGIRSITLPQKDENIGIYPSLLDKSSESRLREIYAPYNERLFTMLGRRIPEWSGSECA